jgi:hypothetical protein
MSNVTFKLYSVRLHDWLTVIFTIFIMGWQVSASAAQLVWSGNFEEGASSIDGSSDADFNKKLYDEGTHALADVKGSGGMGACGAPREGKFSGRTVVLKEGADSRVRAEIKTHLPGVFHFDWDGPEYWVGISLCMSEWPPGSDMHTLMQIHAPNEPSGDPCDFAGNALTISTAGDTGQIRVLDNPSGISEGSGANSNNKIVYKYDIRNTLGEWQDFVFQVKLSTKGSGYYTAWHNDKQVASETGLVNVNWKDSCGRVIEKSYSNGLHIGLYGGPNGAGQKVMYIDSAAIAEGTNGYDLVAPSGAAIVVPKPPTNLQVEQ